jgi:hypothetical protein
VTSTITKKADVYDKYRPEYGDNVEQSIDAIMQVAMSLKARAKITDQVLAGIEFCQQLIRDNPSIVDDGLEPVKKLYEEWLASQSEDSIPEPEPTPDEDSAVAIAIHQRTDALANAVVQGWDNCDQGILQASNGEYTRIAFDKIAQRAGQSSSQVDVQDLDPNESVARFRNLFNRPTQFRALEGGDSSDS